MDRETRPTRKTARPPKLRFLPGTPWSAPAIRLDVQSSGRYGIVAVWVTDSLNPGSFRNSVNARASSSSSVPVHPQWPASNRVVNRLLSGAPENSGPCR